MFLEEGSIIQGGIELIRSPRDSFRNVVCILFYVDHCVVSASEIIRIAVCMLVS